MNQPLLFQSITATLSILLQSVQSESLSTNRPSILRNLGQVQERFAGSPLEDQQRSYAFLLNMVYQVLVVSVDADMYKLVDAKLASHSVQLIAQVVQVLYRQCTSLQEKGAGNTRTPNLNMAVFTEKAADTKMGSVLLLCLSLLEALHTELDIKGILGQPAASVQTHNQIEDKKTRKKGQSADHEEAVMSTLRAFEYTIRAKHHDGNRDNGDKEVKEEKDEYGVRGVLNGDYLAHLVMMCVDFCKYKAKALASQSLSTLLAAIEFTATPSVWRNFFPGVCGALLFECLQGPQRGSQVKERALICLLRLIARVSGGFNELIEDSVQWRVDVLQRMQELLPRVYYSVMRSLSPARKGKVLRCLCKLIQQARAFLGDKLSAEMYCLLLTSVEDDHVAVSRCSLRCWEVLQTREVQRGSWTAVREYLCTELRRAMRTARRMAGTGREEELEQCLGRILGCGHALRGELGTVLAQDEDKSLLEGTLGFLLSPDPDGCQSSRLQSHTYAHYLPHLSAGTSGTPSPLVASYYEPPGLATRSPSNIARIRKLCVLLGQVGILQRLLASVQEWQQHMSDVDATLTNDPRFVVDEQEEACREGAISTGTSKGGGEEESDAGSAVSREEEQVAQRQKEQTYDLTHLDVLRKGAGLWKAVAEVLVGLVGKPIQVVHTERERGEREDATGPISEVGASVSDLAEPTGQDCDILNDARLYAVEGEGDSSTLCGDIRDSEEVLSSWWLSVPMSYRDKDGTTIAAVENLQEAHESIDEAIRSAVAAMAYHLRFLESRYASNPASIKGTLRSLLLANVGEVVAHTCLVSGSDAFQPHLITTLYPLLELSVSSEDIIRVAGMTSVQRLSLYLGYPSVAHLLHGNMDYIVDEVCAAMRPRGGWNYRLGTTTFDAVTRKRNAFLTKKSKRGKKGDSNEEGEEEEEEVFGPHLVVEYFLTTVHEGLANEGKQAPSSEPQLTVAERINSHAVIRDLLRDAISSMDALAENGGLSQRNTLPLLAMMRVLVMKAAEPLEVLPSQTIVIESAGDVLAAKARESLVHFQRNVDILMERNPVIDDKDIVSLKVDPSHTDDTADGEAKETPPGLALIEEVLARCSYYLSLPSLRDKVKVVDIMQQALLRLATRRDVLLPAVHKLWRPLILRVRELRGQFQDEVHQRIAGLNEMSKRKSFLLPVLLDLLAMLADITTNFYSVKWDDDLWPELVVILQCVGKTCLSEAVDRHKKEKEKKRRAASGNSTINNLLSLPTTPSSTMPHLELAEDENTALSSEKFFRMEMYSDPDPAADTSILDQMAQANRHSKFFRANKLRIAVCRCIQSIADMPECEPYVRKAAGVCFWHGLPLLLDPQPEVHQAVSDMIQAMLTLDRSFGRCALECIALAADAHGGSMIRDTANTSLLAEARIRWNNLATDLRIVTTCELFELPYHPYLAVLKGNKRKTTKLIIAPNATQTLTTLVADEAVVSLAREMLQQRHLSPAIVNSWVSKLEIWKAF